MGVKSGESFMSMGLYWNATTSGQSAGCGAGKCEATGLAMEELQSGVPSGMGYSWAERARIDRACLLSYNPPR